MQMMQQQAEQFTQQLTQQRQCFSEQISALTQVLKSNEQTAVTAVQPHAIETVADEVKPQEELEQNEDDLSKLQESAVVLPAATAVAASVENDEADTAAGRRASMDA